MSSATGLPIGSLGVRVGGHWEAGLVSWWLAVGRDGRVRGKGRVGVWARCGLGQKADVSRYVCDFVVADWGRTQKQMLDDGRWGGPDEVNAIVGAKLALTQWRWHPDAPNSLAMRPGWGGGCEQ